jgi:hypothetical protein
MAWRVLKSVFRNRELRRVELAFLGFNSAEWGTWIAMLVFAYQHGGATTAGLVALVQLVPGAIVGPYAGVLADRRGAGRFLRDGYLAQATSMAAVAAALVAGAHPYIVYSLAAVAATTITFTRPAQSALLPAIARSADELTATNVVSGWVESLSVLAAPALAGVLLGVSGPWAVYAAMAALALGSAFLAVGLPGQVGEAGHSGEEASELSEVLAGFRLLKKEREPRLLVSLLGAQFIGIGALDVLFVVLALGLLGMGQSGAGYLNSAFGLGGAVGIGATAALIGRSRLAPPLLAGVAVWLGGLWAFAAYPTKLTAIVLLAVAGAGRSLLDVAGRTLLQRTAPTELLSRVFGVLEGLESACLAIGSILTPVLVGIAGAKGALIGVGSVLPVIGLMAGRTLLRLDRTAIVPVTEIALLRSVPTFAPLGAPELERLARGLSPVEFEAGTTFIRQGEEGDSAYLIAEGDIEVSVDGKHLADLGRGDIVGEIALLRGSPRVASVTAKTHARLYQLERDAFLEAVAGSQAAAGAMDHLIDRRLGEIEELGGTVQP